MKKYLSAFVCGFGAGVLQIVPVAKSFSCCLILPVASYLALVLHQKANNDFGKMEFKKGAIIGLLTGIYAAFFGSSFEIVITLITKNNDLVVAYPELVKLISDFPLTEAMIEQSQMLLESVVEDIKTRGFSILYSLAVIANNLLVDLVFGLIGGIIGVQIINSRIQRNNNTN